MKDCNPISVAIAWTLVLAAVVFTRFRGSLQFYHGLHERLADWGVPDEVRNLDAPLLMLAAAALAVLAAGLLARKGPAETLALRRPRRTWFPMLCWANAPMLVGGLVLMLLRDAAPDAVSLLQVGVRAPVVEEIVFRGALVALPLVALRNRPRVFWPTAIASSILFGAVHAPWTIDGFADAWASVLVAGAGGLWYAWLLREWRSLFVPMVLHASMNLGWTLAAASGGAGGGGLTENLLRVATIAIATAWTMRAAAGPRVAQPHKIQ